MKRKLAGILLSLVLVCGVPVMGAEVPEETVDELYQEQLEQSGANEWMDMLPPETQNLLEGLGVYGADWEQSSVEPEGFFEMTVSLFTGGMAEPLRAAASLIGIMLLCALIGGLRISFGERQLGSVMAAIGTLCACTVITPPILSCIQQSSELIKGAGAFLLAGVPILAGIMLAAGQAVSASGWTIFLLAAGNAISFLSTVVLMPMMNIFLAFSLVSALSPEIRLDGLCTVFAKTVRWVLVLAVTIFTSLLSAQSIVSAAADGVSAKAAKMVTGFIPVVGGVLGDAAGTVQGCIKLLRSGVGAFGLVAGLCLFLPVIIRCLLWIFCCTVCSAVGDLIGFSEITGILKAASQLLQTLLAIVVSCGVVLIVAAVFVMQGGSG